MEIGTERSDIRAQQQRQIFGDTQLNDEISLGDTMAALQYLKVGKAVRQEIH